MDIPFYTNFTYADPLTGITGNIQSRRTMYSINSLYGPCSANTALMVSIYSDFTGIENIKNCFAWTTVITAHIQCYKRLTIWYLA